MINKNFSDVRIQQRNGRKTLTTVQGIPRNLNRRDILKDFKKKFACNGTIVQDVDLGEVIQLQGDQRSGVVHYLADEKSFVSRSMIKVHGF